MAKYHVNYKGEAGQCSASKGGCPFGGEADHFTSADDARAAYEQKAAEHFVMVGVKKTIEGAKAVAAPVEEVKPERKPTEDQQKMNDLMSKLPKTNNQYHLKKNAEAAVDAYKFANEVGQVSRQKAIRDKVAQGLKSGLGARGMNHYYREILEDFTDTDWDRAGADWPKKKQEEVRDLWPANSATYNNVNNMIYRAKTRQPVQASPSASSYSTKGGKYGGGFGGSRSAHSYTGKSYGSGK